MASVRGSGCGPQIAGVALAALMVVPVAAAPGKVLLDETFEAAAVGSKPAAWVPFADEGNDLVVVETPAVGKRSLKLTRERGTVWKPMISGNVHGQAESSLCFEFDFLLPALSAKEGEGLVAVLRGDGNVALVSLLLGCPGGAAVSSGGGWLPLGFPLRAGEWGHVRVVTDPIARKEQGAFDLTLTQGSERMTYPNIPFRPVGDKAFPTAWWHAPTFQAAGGSPGKPSVAFVDNVRITTRGGRDSGGASPVDTTAPER